MPNMRRFLFGLIALTAMFALTHPASAKPGGDDPFTHFGELTKDAEHQDGFFDIYTKREDILLEIPLDRLEEPFLMISSLSKGIGTNFFLGGLYLSFGPAQMMQFERHGDHVFLVELNTKFTADEGSPMANAVDLSYANSVIASMKIKSERRKGDEIGVVPEPPKKDKKKDGDDGDDEEDDDADQDEEEEDEKPKEPVVSLVVDFGEVIQSDISNLSLALNESFKGGYSLDKARTSMNMLKVFPENAEFDVAYVFKSSGKKFIPTLADNRYVPLSVRYSFSKLPEEPMTPRYADDRVGYFMTVQKNFSNDDVESLFVRNINRWRLEKKNKNAAMSEPVKPIVYYMENTIPKEYRKYVKEGVELWQKAFEKAGFKNAIVAKEQPNDDDWSAEDSRYSTIRWITSHNQSFGAIGPSRVDPRTGEILDADILMEANMMAGFRKTYRRYVAGEEDIFPWEASAKNEEEIGNAIAAGDPSGIRCSMGHDLMEAGSILHSALVARGDLSANEPVPMEFVGEAIVWVTAHEVGHTLGLRHNFRSSKSVPFAKLQDKAYVKANGLYGSVMDYPTVNLAANKASQGYYFTPSVGTYDDWAIRYGYTPVKGAKSPEDELSSLAKIASESSNPLHAYGTDEDAYLPGATDPFTNTWDLSSDPLTWAEQRAGIIESLYTGLEDRAVADGQEWSYLTTAFSSLMGQYYRSMAVTARFIGGKETSRAHKGEPNAALPFTPLKPAEQRRALDILSRNCFAEKPYEMPQSFYNKLGANNMSHWGTSIARSGRRDFPYHQAVASIQNLVLNRLMNDFTLEKIVDNELGHTNPFTLVELFGQLNQDIFAEVGVNGFGKGVRAGAGSASTATRNVPSFRRGLQRAWLNHLVRVSMNQQIGPMADARSVARMTLVDLQDHLDKALQNPDSLDGYTKAHFMDSRELVAKALNAGYEAELMKKR